jgi:hypothetical protein
MSSAVLVDVGCCVYTNKLFIVSEICTIKPEKPRSFSKIPQSSL